MTPRRFALLTLGLLVGWQIAVFDPAALPSILLAVAAAAAVLAIEETRVREARSEARSAHRRECRHGGSSWQPHEGDAAERGQS